MILSDEERKIIVELELGKANRTYEAAMLMVNNEHWESAANRLYYALYHIVNALLIHDGHQVNTHKGSHALFGQYYIKTGKLPRLYSIIYQKLEAIRDESDYNWAYNITPEDILEKTIPAREMIDAITKMIKENND
ncbi:MAG: HEPN domain-containing protein [Bacteroidales bacterium]|nr:HEPN domain-containing protein [Bacteroidales bacterium]